MPLSAGDQLGPYVIVERIGAGGMGAVYRAHDARLRRDVALKVSEERFGERFEREARAVAALNHPNICALYDVGPDYLVMELVEGKSPKGPLPFETVLEYARQIAAALEAAHDKGIVHRDLKPGNVMIRTDGVVKLLDFGLAKALHETPLGDEMTMVATQTASLTEAGIVIGTVAYMSPEQAQGLPVDKRTDIWAFGVMLYELFTGKRPFRGPTVTAVLANVLKEDPDWADVPARARRLLKSCLAKDPARRLRDIGDAMALVDEEAVGGGIAKPSRRLLWGAVAAVVAAIALSLAAGRMLSPAPTEEIWSGSVLSGPETAFDPRISPDGRLLAFQAMDHGQTQVAVMTPESGNWSVLTHNLALGGPTEIAWARDGASIYYDRVADVPRGIFSVPVLGGEEKLVLDDAMAPEVLADGSLLVYRLNAQRNLQLNRYWPETGRLQELPVICRSEIGTLTVHIRAAPDGKEAVVVGTSLGQEKEADRLLAVDVNTGAWRALTPTGMSLDGNAAAVSRDGESVVMAIREDALRRIVSIPLHGTVNVKFAPRTLFNTSISIWGLDTGPNRTIYVNTVDGPGTVARISADGSRGEVIGNLPDNSGDPLISLPDGRVVVSIRGLGGNRLIALAVGKTPVPLVATAEETSPPMTAVGPGRIAFMIGVAPHASIALADSASGRVVVRISPGKGEIAALAASPDGATLYFSAGRKIWSVSSTGAGQPALIHTGDSVTADADGQNLVIGSIERAKISLFRVSLVGGPDQEITSDGSIPLGPVALSPNALRKDGRLLLLVAPLDQWFTLPAILDTHTGRITRVHSPELPNAAYASWTTDGQIVGVSRRPATTLWRFQPVEKGKPQ
jgi:hypothetical protein